MKNVLREDKLSFVFKPTLLHIAMAKVAIQMWMQDDVMALMPETKKSYYMFTDNTNVIMKLREKVRNLPLPKRMQEELPTIIKPLGTQIYQWCRYLRLHFHVDRINPKTLCWTPQGTIAPKKSLLLLIREQRLDVAERYKLARAHCLAGEIVDLREELAVDLLYVTDYGLRAFQSAVSDYNSVAAKFIFENKLNPAEKKRVSFSTQQELKKFSLFSYTPDVFLPDLQCAMLSGMDREQQVEIFEAYSQEILTCFLVWPYQCLFLETAKRMWRFISKDIFKFLLLKIFLQMDYGGKICVYRDIYRQLWRLGSAEYRKHVINDHSSLGSFIEMFENGEEDICRLMLAEIDAEEKQSLQRANVYFYMGIVLNEKWNVLKLFLKECGGLSTDTIAVIKCIMINCCYCGKASVAKQRQEFYRILDSFVIPDQQK